VGDTVSADKALGEAISLARATKDTPLLTEALIKQADLLLARGDRARAVEVAREAAALTKRSQDLRLRLLARLQVGAASRSIRDLEAVAQEAQSASLLPVIAMARLAVARIHLAAGRAPDAARAAAQAQTVAAPMHLRDLLFQACHVGGKALKTQGQTAAAQSRFRDALGFLEEMRQGLSGADLDLFLARPETTEFGRDASTMFQGANLHQEADRLKALLRP